MAPKKGPAVPKKTVDEVNAEYSAKRDACAGRIAALQKQLALAKSQSDQARLELVAIRENRVFFGARVTASTSSNESFEQDASRRFEDMNKELKQLKRAGKDKSYEVAYVRDVASSVEREVVSVQNSLAQIEADSQTDPRVLEAELDRLASNASLLGSERDRLSRTVIALKAAKERLVGVLPKASVAAVESVLQLTLIGSSSVGGDLNEDTVRHVFSAPHRGSVTSCAEVIQKVEQALTAHCGFDLVERIVPFATVATERLSAICSSDGLYSRLVAALHNAASGPSSLEQADDLVNSVVVIHCPSRCRPVRHPDGTEGPESEMVLLVSQLSDEAKQLLRSTADGRHVDMDGFLSAELPLTMITSILFSSSQRQHVTLIVDTWPAPVPAVDAVGHCETIRDRCPSPSFCLFWSKAEMCVPIVYEYRSPHNPTAVTKHHSESSCLDAAAAVPRGVMLQCLATVVEATDAPHLLDAVMAGRAVQAMMERFAAQCAAVQNFVGTPYAALAMDVAHLRQVHHILPLRSRPLASEQPLHFEGRRLDPDSALWESALPLSAHTKWRRTSKQRAAVQVFHDTAHNSSKYSELEVLRHHAEESSRAPHARWIVDLCIEDPSYHESEESVENLGMERSLAAEDMMAHVVVHTKRPKTLRSDEDEWGHIFARRMRQSMIASDEQQRRLCSTLKDSPQLSALVPKPLGGTSAVANGSSPSFDVVCCPLSPDDIGQRVGVDAAFRAALRPEEWCVEGKRCPERTAVAEFVLVLDVKPHDSDAQHRFESVTQAKDALAHSVKRRFELLCEELDINRPVEDYVQVAHHVHVVRCGGPADTAHFKAHIALAAIVTEKFARENGAQTLLIATRWLRISQTALSRRWQLGSGKEWIACAETTLASTSTDTTGAGDLEAAGAVFRVVKLFYVLRQWQAGVRLAETSGLSSVEIAKRVAWLEHLMYSVAESGGVLGSASNPPNGPCVRLLSASVLPPHVGLQRGALCHGALPRNDASCLGPSSRLNDMSELELAAAVSLLRTGERDIRLAAASEVVRSLHKSIAGSSASMSNTSQARRQQGIVLLCWVIPCSFRRAVQPVAAAAAAGALIVSDVRYMVHSLSHQLHMQDRFVVPPGQQRRLPFRIVTTTFEWDDTQPLAATQAVDVSLIESLLKPGAASCVAAAPALKTLPLDELGINRDEDTGDAAAVSETPVAQDADDPADYDESFRPLKSACLFKRSPHAALPQASLFPVPQRFWTRMRDENADVLRRIQSGELGAAWRVRLMAVVWQPQEDGDESSPPDVYALDPHFIQAHLQTPSGDDTAATVFEHSFSVAGDAAVDAPLRARFVELFVQRIMHLSSGSVQA